MLLDAATLQKSSEIDPVVLEFIKANPSPELDWDNAAQLYEFVEAMGKQMAALEGAAEAAIVEEYRDIAMRDGFASTIKVHRPATAPASGSPVVVFFFGGGWISGNKDAGTSFARALIRAFGAVVVSASYRLAPQHKFPVSVNDCWDTVKWVDAHAGEVHGDPARGFILSGVSAGASNAACITAHAQQEKLQHPITGQFLCVPSLMDKEHVPAKFRPYFLAHEQNRHAPVLPYSALASLQRLTEWNSASPWRFAVNSPTPLAALPPTYLQADGLDPLRDDSLIYEEMLKEAGVKTRLDFYPGCPHAHFAMFPGIEPSNRMMADMVVGVGWLLGKEVTREQGLGAFVKPQ